MAQRTQPNLRIIPANLNARGAEQPPLFLPGMTPSGGKVEEAKGFRRLFTGGKASKDEVLVIDFVTPHTGVQCEHDGCTLAAIPLVNLCELHDTLCSFMRTSRAEKRAAEHKPTIPSDTPYIPPRKPALAALTAEEEAMAAAYGYDSLRH